MSVAEEKKGNRKTGNKAKANPTRDWAPLTHISYYGTQTEQCLYAIFMYECINVCMDILISVCILQHIIVCVYIYIAHSLIFYFYWFCLGSGHCMLFTLCDWLTDRQARLSFGLYLCNVVANGNSEVGSFLCVYFILSFAKPFNNNSNSNRH